MLLNGQGGFKVSMSWMIVMISLHSFVVLYIYSVCFTALPIKALSSLPHVFET